MEEVLLARQVAKNTKDPAVKQILNQFLENCPQCGAPRENSSGYNWRIDIDTIYNPPISEDFIEGYDLVRYRCECGCVFKKIESTV
ncbi:hypothetical protein [Halocella sp. SP3-1]|uniref:hypothetical protein n=1 Tax=Halocella sp. SP3-1 TaxID=2382161 RepID=UPI000F759F7D|nr:hypothetical protein [Halocella sp. SP3-1]AZO95242.1 hypothetical protein D7D81_11945 [Halocella sp. SP3-1]